MWRQDQYKKAIDFAAQAHDDQPVPGSRAPYVVHLSKVAKETLAACVADPRLDADLAAACALLHDCVEDAGVTLAQLETEFGASIARGVSALTKNAELREDQRMGDSLARIKEQPREVWIVKLADRITNLEPPPAHWSKEKRERYRGEASDILAELRGASVMLEARLEEKIIAYAAYC